MAEKTDKGSGLSTWLQLSRKTSLAEAEGSIKNQLFRLTSWREGLLKTSSEGSEPTDHSDSPLQEVKVKTEVVLQPPSPGRSSEDFYFQDPTELESACVVALSSVVQLRDSAGDISGVSMVSYIQEVFSLPSEKYDELYSKAKQVQCPELKLKCTVISATRLEAKDASGTSDPYCRLAVLHRRHQDSSSVKKGNLSDWETAGILSEPVQRTSVKYATLEPTWNEDFSFTLTDPKENLLVVEVWDSDEETVGVAKIRGFKGIGNFFQDLKKGDDFMGRTFYLLQTVPVQGEERVLTLYSHSAKHDKGAIKLHLCIRGLRENVPVITSIREYSLLMKAVIQHESKKEGHYEHTWNSEISFEGERLLLLYASLNGLSPLQQAAVRLSVLLEYHKVYAVKMDVFSALIHEIRENRLQLPGGSEEIRVVEHQPLWVTQLFKDLLELGNYILDMMKNHLMVIDLKSEEGIAEMRDHIKTLVDLYTFRPYVARLSENQKRIQDVLENCIKAAVPRWFLVLCGKSMPLINTEEEQAIAFKGLLQHCHNHCQRVARHVAPIFKEIGVDYFTHFFVSLDKLLHGEAVSRLENFGGELANTSFEIFLIFRQMKGMAEYVDESSREDLEICQYERWFKMHVNSWIKMANQRCMERIEKAIKIDEEVDLPGHAKFSSSAIDTKAFLLQMGSFWQHLDWPAAAEAYGFTMTIMKSITESALYYVEAVYGDLKETDIHDEQGRFRASKRLCVVLNNMATVRKALSELQEKLELQKYYDWLTETAVAQEKERKRRTRSEGAKGEEEAVQDAGVGKQAERLINCLLSSADDDIANKIRQIVEQISGKLSPDICQFLKKMMAAPQSVTTREGITPLLDYLTSNLQTLGDFLLYDVFWSILHPLWDVALLTLQQCMVEVPKKQTPIYLYIRLYEAAAILKEFFFAGGNGLGTADLDTVQYQNLLSDLEVLRLPSKDLVLRVLSDLARQQVYEAEHGQNKLGMIRLSIGYLRDSSMVEVTVIQGMKLPGLDKSGLSDPFVELRLLPVALFPESGEKTVKTTVQKQTLDPIYNEEFKMPAKEEDLDKEGTILLLAVYDHDVIGSNDFAGLCIVSCKDIPRLARSRASVLDPDATERKNLLLPLFHAKETLALRELETRSCHSDSIAAKSLKGFNRYLEHVSRSPHSFRRMYRLTL